MIIFFSWWLSLKGKRYHGIPRFFAFESILALVLINAPYWFHHPFSPYQVVSWILLIASIPSAFFGFYLLLIHGRHKGNFEQTTILVEKGLYKYIRHPMYASLIFIGTGAFLKSVTLTTTILAMVNVIALFLTSLIEEKEMTIRFGDSYRQYMNRTKMFIPFVW
jgi:protein-S-isoprenylcysteine O-methyltransferase Ste14